MSSSILQFVDQCLALLIDPTVGEDDKVFVSRLLLVVPNEAELSRAQLEEVERALGSATAPALEVALIELLTGGQACSDPEALFARYVTAVQALGPLTSPSRFGATLGSFYSRLGVPGRQVWSELVSRFGLDLAVRLLAGAPQEGLPGESLELLARDLSSRKRSQLLWDFAMVACPEAWRYPSARRPTTPTSYWQALLDWPIQNSERSRELVEEGLLSQHEASVIGDFGQKLFTILQSYEATPPESVLIADDRLVSLGRAALEQLFGKGAVEFLAALYGQRRESS